jgi:hypothetical protein
MSFKEEIALMLQTELDSNQFIIDIVTRFQETIRQSIVNPGIDTVVIMDILSAEPLTEQQITQVKMACIKHIGVPVDVSPIQMIVFMDKFLQ